MSVFFPEGFLGSFRSAIINRIFRHEGGFNRYFYNQLLGTKSPIYIDTQNLWRVYSTHAILNTVINKRANLLSLGKLRLRNKETKKEIFTHDVLTLMRKPNPLQTFSEYITQYLVYKDIYGNAVIYKNNKVFGTVPAALWNLPPETIKINPTGKIFNQTSIEGIIDSYTMTLAGETTTFKPSEIIIKNDNVDSIYLKSQSKILALVEPLSNLQASSKTTNVMLYDAGGKGILSNASKEDGGSIPLGKEERDRLEKDYLGANGYGITEGQKKVILTNASLTYTPMSFPIKDMNLDAIEEREFGRILDAYDVDRDMFSSTKGATFENKAAGLKSTIQNAIQPEADDFCETLNDNFGITEQGLELFMTYDHLPAMQEDQVSTEQAFLYKTQAVQLQKQMGLINGETAAKILEIEFTGTGESEITTPTTIDPNNPKPNEEQE